MQFNLTDAIIAVTAILYNFSIVAGTAYLVVCHDWSMWTFLLAMCFITSVKTKDNDNANKEQE